jgi:hypothetical protein
MTLASEEVELLVQPTTYKWKKGSHHRVDPQVAYECLADIEKRTGLLTAEMVVDDARSKRSPLHDEFEWRNTHAAEEYRKWQARSLMNSIVVVKLGPEEQPSRNVRAFVVIQEDIDRGYKSTYVAFNNPEWREQVVARAWRELQTWRQRYEDLNELADVFAALDGFTDRS